MLGPVRETVVSWNIGLSGNFANEQDLSVELSSFVIQNEICVFPHLCHYPATLSKSCVDEELVKK